MVSAVVGFRKRTLGASGLSVTMARAAASLRRIQTQPPDQVDLIVIASAVKWLRLAIRLLRYEISNCRESIDWWNRDTAVIALITNYFREKKGLDAQAAIAQIGQITNALIEVQRGGHVDSQELEKHCEVIGKLADEILRVA